MKNRRSSVISKVLAVVLIIGIMPVFSFAGDSAESDPYASLKVKTDGSATTGYVAIGDSYTRGYAASDHFKDQIYLNEMTSLSADATLRDVNCRNVDGSYPNYVAKELGFSKFNNDGSYADDNINDKNGMLWPICHDAESVAYMLDLLGIEDDFTDEEIADPVHYYNMSRRYNADLALYGDPNSFNLKGQGKYGQTGSVMSVREMIKNAGLITIQLGQSDILFKTLLLDADKMFEDGTFSSSEITEILKNLNTRYKYWKKYYPIMLKDIVDNTEAKVVIIGAMNPLENMVFSDDVLLPIGSAFSIITDSMNRCYKKWANQYGCLYVDINNVDTPSTEGVVTFDALKNLTNLEGDAADLQGHPTPNGYKQIGRMIVAAVDKELAADAEKNKAKEEGKPYVPTPPGTDIKVDIGTDYQYVNYVKLNGKTLATKRYSVEKNVLTVKCSNKNAKTLDIAIARLVNKDGPGKKEIKITAMNYLLRYNEKTGYSARRTYVTNDAVQTAKVTMSTIRNIATTIKDAVQSVTDKISTSIKDLFGSFRLPDFNNRSN